jgi:hypothetical protein
MPDQKPRPKQPPPQKQSPHDPSPQKPSAQKPPALAEHGGDQPLKRPVDKATVAPIPLTPPEPHSPPV